MAMPGLPFGWDRFTDEQKLFKRGWRSTTDGRPCTASWGLMVLEKLRGYIPIVGDRGHVSLEATLLLLAPAKENARATTNVLGLTVPRSLALHLLCRRSASWCCWC